MALRPAPKRNSVDYQKLDDLQKEIFGSEKAESKTPAATESKDENISAQNGSDIKKLSGKPAAAKSTGGKRIQNLQKTRRQAKNRLRLAVIHRKRSRSAPTLKATILSARICGI